MSSDVAVESPDVIIVGAGFSGIGMAIRMLDRGFTDFVLLERADDVGGTWRDNTYPGCACDIPSRVYCYSFAQNPEWSTGYPRQEEIWDYMRATVDRFGVRPYLRLGHELRSARWQEPGVDGNGAGAAGGHWEVETNRGLLRSRVLVTGMGPLSEGKLPEIPGTESFAGASFHTSSWDSSHDLGGERVAVVGTGASAVQAVPEIQPEVSSLSVFQRTPPWIMPRLDREVSGLEKAIYRRLPIVQRLQRALHFALLESRGFPFFIEPKTFPFFERIALRHLASQVPDPELRAKLTPEYTLGCKRILGSSTFYPALQASNAELVSEPITEIRPGSIITADGAEREVDTIIWGTGFEVIDMPLGRPIYGRGGRRLADAWGGNPEGYRGSAVAGYPNLFTLVGPNVGLGHNSMVYLIESQINYVLDGLQQMRDKLLHSVEVRPAAQRAFNERIQSKMDRTVWMSGCQSWYMNDEGSIHTLWPMSSWRFRAELKHFDLAAYSAVPEASEGTAIVA